MASQLPEREINVISRNKKVKTDQPTEVA